MSKQKAFSLINLSGLTIGIACSLLILLFVQDELSFDQFHADADRIYRVGFEGRIQGKQTTSAQTGFALASALQEVSEVESTMRMASWGTFPVSYQDKAFTEKYLLLADQNFFRFFSFNLLEGHPDSVLAGERKVVISESAAKRYFNYKGKGDTTPLGKTVIFAQGYTVQVSGIAEDPPLQSHFHFTLILSLSSWETTEANDWITGRLITYYKTVPGADPDRTESKITNLLERRLNDEMEKLRNTNLEQYKQQGTELRYFVQPLQDIHLKSNLSDEIEVNGSIQNIYLFSCIAIFITLLACINFMNLTTAQSASRAKEVAVRKSVGANHDRLVRQFLLESYFYVIAAVILALAIVVPALAPFNFFTGKNISLYGLFNAEFVGGILAFIFITGLVAGSYPAFYLTHFSPIEVLKGNLRARIRTYGIRNVLVVFQFFISAVLIIATLVVYSQLRFIQKADLGFDKTHVINLLHTRNLGTHGSVFKEELLKHPGVASASYCNRLPPNIDWRSMFRPVGQQKDFLFSVYEVDHDHLEAMGYKMVSGRFFTAGNRRDTLSVVINETAARKLGLADFSHKKLFTDYDLPSGREREIIGIIQDFNFQSLKEPIQPLAIVPGPSPNWEMAIRLTGQDTDETVRAIRALWDKYAPHAPFEYSLLEKNFDSKHGSEKRIGFLFMIFTVLAILIACLGLFGLATFTAEQHRKQIGIRKVLGASVANIVRMLNQNFLKLVLLANLIAWPFTWWIMNQWLDQFAFHAGISWWIFALSTTVTFIIAFFSISYRAFKAATGNPVDSLRNE